MLRLRDIPDPRNADFWDHNGGDRNVDQPCDLLQLASEVRRGERLGAEADEGAARCCTCSGLQLARLGSAWLRESIPLTGVKQTAMLRRGNAN
jgi:hypothetical protein